MNAKPGAVVREKVEDELVITPKIEEKLRRNFDALERAKRSTTVIGGTVIKRWRR